MCSGFRLSASGFSRFGFSFVGLSGSRTGLRFVATIRDLRFVSGHRFSDAVSGAIAAALAAGTAMCVHCSA